MRRFNIFKSNIVAAKKLEKRNPLATFGVNVFSDLTSNEFKVYHNLKPDEYSYPNTDILFSPKQIQASKASFDWRKKGAVTPVMNQGSAGSCWAFSTTGNIEGQSFLAGHALVALSAEELYSCCNTGGTPPGAMKWLTSQRNGDIMTEKYYPYTASSSVDPPCEHTCRGIAPPGTDEWCSTNCYATIPQCPPTLCNCTSDGVGIGATISSWRMIPSDEGQMRAWSSTNGPISIQVDGSSFQSYKSGIMTDCTSRGIDHAVLIVGYGEESGTSYWIIKNSWGTDWGENGYIRVQYGTNQCLLKNLPATAVVTKRI